MQKNTVNSTFFNAGERVKLHSNVTLQRQYCNDNPGMIFTKILKKTGQTGDFFVN